MLSQAKHAFRNFVGGGEKEDDLGSRGTSRHWCELSKGREHIWLVTQSIFRPRTLAGT